MFDLRINWILFLLLNSCQLLFCQDESESVKALRKELFVNRNYDKYSFPVKTHNKTIEVGFFHRILKIVDLNTKTQLLTTNSYIRAHWIDEHLSWNPSDFGGQTQLVISSDFVWTPDITLPNGPKAYDFESHFKTSTLWLNSDGRIEFQPYMTQTQTYCRIDMTLYPNDVQKCRMVFESYFQTKNVVFKPWGFFNITYYARAYIREDRRNPHWEIAELTSNDTKVWIPGNYNPRDFHQIRVYVTLQRRQSLLYYFIKTPIFVAIVLSIVMMTFPPNSLKRFKLSSLSLSILFVVLLFVVNRIGFYGNTGIPQIVIKTSMTIVFIAVLIFCSIFLNMMFNSNGSLPHFISIIIRNPLMKVIGVGDYLIDLTVKEGKESGISIEFKTKTKILTESQNQWILLTLLLDKIILLAYILFLISIFT